MKRAGLEWYKADCRPEAKVWTFILQYGLEGKGFIDIIYEQIFGYEGYYMPWIKNKSEKLFLQLGVKAEKVNEMIEAAIDNNIFNKELYINYGILTSQTIQEKYYSCVDRRKNKIIDPRYTLLDSGEDSSVNGTVQSEQTANNCLQNAQTANSCLQNVQAANNCLLEKTRQEKTRPDKTREDKDKSISDETKEDISQGHLTPEQWSELVGLSSEDDVKIYIMNMLDWEKASGNLVHDPFNTIKGFITSDKRAGRQPQRIKKNEKKQPEKESGVDLEEVDSFAESFVIRPDGTGGRKGPDSRGQGDRA